ncbi:MAG: tRNA (N6-threonylcarbamoyladenosine(37)-N6)-methyltransferase TrmO [Acidimicrobiales bacterium]
MVDEQPTGANGTADDGEAFILRPIGRVASSLTDTAAAPKQSGDGAPAATLVLDPGVVDGLDGLDVGMQVIVLTWLHRSRRDLLVVHPRSDPEQRARGVFSTRSPVRPNPIGIHPVRIVAIDANVVEVDGLEAIDGTPVLDIKPARGVW